MGEWWMMGGVMAWQWDMGHWQTHDWAHLCLQSWWICRWRIWEMCKQGRARCVCMQNWCIYIIHTKLESSDKAVVIGGNSSLPFGFYCYFFIHWTSSFTRRSIIVADRMNTSQLFVFSHSWAQSQTPMPPLNGMLLSMGLFVWQRGGAGCYCKEEIEKSDLGLSLWLRC